MRATQRDEGGDHAEWRRRLCGRWGHMLRIRSLESHAEEPDLAIRRRPGGLPHFTHPLPCGRGSETRSRLSSLWVARRVMRAPLHVTHTAGPGGPAQTWRSAPLKVPAP